jgi:folate-binding protein YgfZ
VTETAQLAQSLIGPAAIAPITDRAFLRITGPDATRWLNGMVTNNIKDLAPGQGNYNFLLNAQGRIQADCTIYREPEADPIEYLLETDKSQIDTIEQTLDRFIIMDDVQIAQIIYIYAVVQAKAGLILTGENAPQLLKRAVSDQWENSFPEAPSAGTITRACADGSALFIITPPHTAVPTYELWCEGEQSAGLIRDRLIADGATRLSPETLESLRILSATPKYGIDIRNTDTHKDLPQETAQTHALNFNKGCYLGQEIVERIHSRGQVHRTFTQFTLTGDLPTLPAPLTAAALGPDGQAKPAGELTSAARIGDHIYAIGYIRREILETHQSIAYPGGAAVPR